MIKLRFRMKDLGLERFGLDLIQNCLVLSYFAISVFF